MTNYFNVYNVFKLGRDFLDRLDVLYERVYMMVQSTTSYSVYLNSEEQVDAISDSKEQVEGISDSEKQVDAVSEAKAYRDDVFRNESENMNVFEQDNNSGSRIVPDSQINLDSRINSPIRINSEIRPTCKMPMTRPTDFELLTRPTISRGK